MVELSSENEANLRHIHVAGAVHCHTAGLAKLRHAAQATRL